jgi:hypothetical protein
MSDVIYTIYFKHFPFDIRGPFKKFVDWRQCAAVMQREAVTVMPSVVVVGVT